MDGKKWAHEVSWGTDFDVQYMRVVAQIPIVSARLAQTVTLGDRAGISRSQAETLNQLGMKN